MRSARFIGDYVLDQVAAGQGELFAGFDDLSVMRVQEALAFLGYSPGKLDGVFGPNTGIAVSAFKRDKGLTPTDPVVGKGTVKALDAAVYFDPPYYDPAFGELSSYVVRQGVYFSNNSELDDISTQLFHAAADEAEWFADDPSAAHVMAPDGVSPLPQDYVFPP